MSFKELSIKSEYRTLHDNITKDFFIPLLSQAVSYKRSVGFFSSTALVKFSNGICKFVENGGKIQLVASPYLSDEDIIAIKNGYEKRDIIIENALLRELKEPKNISDANRLNLLANLIANGTLDIKIAFTKLGMYHEKLGIIEDAENNYVAFSGSLNESANAFQNNYESIDVFFSWNDPEFRAKNKKDAFEQIWNGKDLKLRTIEFPSLKSEITKRYKKTPPKYDMDDADSLYFIPEPEGCELWDKGDPIDNKCFFNFPSNIKPRPYQNEAIEKFVENDFQCLFAMATGTGKTLTSLFAANELSRNKPLDSIIIIVPLKDLVDQWARDIQRFYSGEIITIRSGLNWKEKISDLSLLKILNKKNTHYDHLIIITTYDSFSINYSEILSIISDYSLIIADEVHKFGASTYSQKLPDIIKYRIGLSATPKRPYDDKGTKAIFDYFCPSNNSYEFTIKDAIDNNMLCHYNYYPIIVFLTDYEMESYDLISDKIKRLSTILNNSNHISDADKMHLEQLLKARHRIIEHASNKKDIFIERMSTEILKYKDKTLVFCPDGYNDDGEDFLLLYKKELWNKLFSKGIIVRMSEYIQGTGKKVIDSFAKGTIDILFAKQRLNEGIDIPATKRAFFISSSTSEREFIQRRGRVLRKAEGKTLAEIFDLIVVPPDNYSLYSSSIINSEIKRAMDFAKTADNYSEIENILKKYL